MLRFEEKANQGRMLGWFSWLEKTSSTTMPKNPEKVRLLAFFFRFRFFECLDEIFNLKRNQVRSPYKHFMFRSAIWVCRDVCLMEHLRWNNSRLNIPYNTSRRFHVATNPDSLPFLAFNLFFFENFDWFRLDGLVFVRLSSVMFKFLRPKSVFLSNFW